MLPIDPPLTRGASPEWRHERVASGPEIEALRSDPDDHSVQTDLARSLLERDPENLWAMAVLARGAESDFEALVMLREAVRVGLRLWASALDGSNTAPDWAANLDARVFTGLVRLYGLALMDIGFAAEAPECLAFLLRLDPADQEGATAAFADAGLVAPASAMRM